MSNTSERERLIGEVIRHAKKGQKLNLPLATVADVERALKMLRSKSQESNKYTDERLLQLLLVTLGVRPEEFSSPEDKEIQSLIDEGKKLFYKRRFDEARTVLKRCLEISIRTNSGYGIAWAKQYMGRIERDSGQFDAAMVLYEEALEIAQADSDANLIAILYDQIGTAFRLRGDLDQAQTYYQMALVADPESASFVNGNMAILQQLRGKIKEAKRLNAASQRAYQDEGNRRGEAISCISQAQQLLKEGNLLQGAQVALQAYRLARETSYTQAEENVEAVWFYIYADLLGDTQFPEGFRRLLKLNWQPEDWQIRRNLLGNAFMGSATKGFIEVAAEFGWILVKLAIEHDDNALLKNFRKRGFFKKGELRKVEILNEQQYAAARTGKSPMKFAAAALGLAYSRAAYEKFEEGKELALRASSLFEECNEPSKAQNAKAFHDEIAAFSKQRAKTR